MISSTLRSIIRTHHLAGRGQQAKQQKPGTRVWAYDVEQRPDGDTETYTARNKTGIFHEGGERRKLVGSVRHTRGNFHLPCKVWEVGAGLGCRHRSGWQGALGELTWDANWYIRYPRSIKMFRLCPYTPEVDCRHPLPLKGKLRFGDLGLRDANLVYWVFEKHFRVCPNTPEVDCLPPLQLKGKLRFGALGLHGANCAGAHNMPADVRFDQEDHQMLRGRRFLPSSGPLSVSLPVSQPQLEPVFGARDLGSKRISVDIQIANIKITIIKRANQHKTYLISSN